jgi:hypothetical protein
VLDNSGLYPVRKLLIRNGSVIWQHPVLPSWVEPDQGADAIVCITLSGWSDEGRRLLDCGITRGKTPPRCVT